MARTIARCLVPGGRLIATIGDLGHRSGIDYSSYGMTTNATVDLPEGAPYSITFLLDADTFSITDFNHSQATYEAACEASGLEVLGWHTCTVTDEGVSRFGQEYWSQWLAHPCLLRLEARKHA